MVVIQHEGEIARITACQVICHHSQHGLRRRGLRRVQHSQRDRPHLCIKGLQSGNQIGEKARGVIVLRF
jgi:hypothetical protein